MLLTLLYAMYSANAQYSVAFSDIGLDFNSQQVHEWNQLTCNYHAIALLAKQQVYTEIVSNLKLPVDHRKQLKVLQFKFYKQIALSLFRILSICNNNKLLLLDQYFSSKFQLLKSPRQQTLNDILDGILDEYRDTPVLWYPKIDAMELVVLLDVIQWYIYGKSIHFNGQFATHQDIVHCLANDFEYVVDDVFKSCIIEQIIFVKPE